MDFLTLTAALSFSVLATGVRDLRILDLAASPRTARLMFGCVAVLLTLIAVRL